MTGHESARSPPPEADEAFDVGTPDALSRMTELFARHGDIYRMYVPTRRAFTYVIHHPVDVKRVLQSHHDNYTKGADRDRIKILLGLGLMTSEEPIWSRHHRLIQPFFHRSVIARLTDAMEAATARFLTRLAEHARSATSINLTQALSELTLEIMLTVIFGADADSLCEPFSLISRDAARNLDFVYRFRALGRLVLELMHRRRSGAPQQFDYLAFLLQARDAAMPTGFSEREIIDEVMTLLIAGHETTAGVLNWTWLLLSDSPECEARLHAELTSRARDGEALGPAFSDRSYARQVLNEVMRLYPPGWLLSRRAIGPDQLSGCDIESGANVFIPLYLLHRDPRYWPEPARFDPDRFAPGASAARSQGAYLPFSAGPRHCIGETLALSEMLFHLRAVVPHYRLTHVPEGPIELEAQVNLRTRRPLRMRVESR